MNSVIMDTTTAAVEKLLDVSTPGKVRKIFVINIRTVIKSYIIYEERRYTVRDKKRRITA